MLAPQPDRGLRPGRQQPGVGTGPGGEDVRHPGRFQPLDEGGELGLVGGDQDQSLGLRAALHGQDAAHRGTVPGVAAQAIDRLGGIGHHPAPPNPVGRQAQPVSEATIHRAGRGQYPIRATGGRPGWRRGPGQWGRKSRPWPGRLGHRRGGMNHRRHGRTGRDGMSRGPGQAPSSHPPALGAGEESCFFTAGQARPPFPCPVCPPARGRS